MNPFPYLHTVSFQNSKGLWVEQAGFVMHTDALRYAKWLSDGRLVRVESQRDYVNVYFLNKVETVQEMAA